MTLSRKLLILRQSQSNVTLNVCLSIYKSCQHAPKLLGKKEYFENNKICTDHENIEAIMKKQHIIIHSEKLKLNNKYETLKGKEDVLEWLEQPNEIIQKAKCMKSRRHEKNTGTNA